MRGKRGGWLLALCGEQGGRPAESLLVRGKEKAGTEVAGLSALLLGTVAHANWWLGGLLLNDWALRATHSSGGPGLVQCVGSDARRPVRAMRCAQAGGADFAQRHGPRQLPCLTVAHKTAVTLWAHKLYTQLLHGYKVQAGNDQYTRRAQKASPVRCARLAVG